MIIDRSGKELGFKKNWIIPKEKKKMKLNYFDLGLFKGEELGFMINDITKRIDKKLISECKFYGFEAALNFCAPIRDIYRRNKNVKIYHRAISNREGKIKLYGMAYKGCNIVGGLITGNSLGSSIYPTKKNVSKDKFEMVKAIKFSDFVAETIPTFKEDFNIVKINIEGAEWDFFNDIVDNDLLKHINIICGAGGDVHKCSELDLGAFNKLLEDNHIKIHRFTEWKRKKNVNMVKLINKELSV